MTELSKAERKKARRRARKAAERAGGQELEAVTAEAVELALALAPEVAAAVGPGSSERPLEVSVATLDGARFVRKRINEALAYNEWHNEVEVWVWESDTSTRPPLTEHGQACGFELRIEQVSPSR